MKIKVILSTVLLVLLGTGVLWAGQPWKGKPWTEWTFEETVKVSQDSPWAVKEMVTEISFSGSTTIDSSPGTTTPRQVEVYNEQGGVIGYKPAPGDHGGPSSSLPPSRTRSRIESIVQWASSLTIRQAMLRQRQLQGEMTEEQIIEELSRQPEYYVIVVRGRAATVALIRFTCPTLPTPCQPGVVQNPSQEALRESAYLEPEGSKQQIHPSGTSFIQEKGQGATVVFYFPRDSAGEPTIGPQEKKVEFRWNAPRKTGWESVDIKATFDLRKMVRDGKPDL